MESNSLLESENLPKTILLALILKIPNEKQTFKFFEEPTVNFTYIPDMFCSKQRDWTELM